MRERGFCFQQASQTWVRRLTVFSKKQCLCHAPKGAAARCCSLKALGWACWSGSGTSLRFFGEPPMKEQREQYVKRVKERRGNEEATKHSLIGPLFGILCYDMLV